ncbi:hypothetical protein EDB19DRAFT_1823495 [Suillus lakei]|nr:hypothetical protein EDB19DRAFT_1823495 [Suillus lakei]
MAMKAAIISRTFHKHWRESEGRKEASSLKVWRSKSRFLAGTLAFMTYTLTTHDFNVAAIFALLSLFQMRSCPAAYMTILKDKQILQQPMLFLPHGLSVIPDAPSVIQWLMHIFCAELIPEDVLMINTNTSWVPCKIVVSPSFWSCIGCASGGKDNNQAEEVAPLTGITIKLMKLKSERAREKAAGSGKLKGHLMAQKKWLMGSVSWRDKIACLCTEFSGS